MRLDIVAGLHKESLLEAEEQLALLTAQLESAAVPASLALLQVPCLYSLVSAAYPSISEYTELLKCKHFSVHVKNAVHAGADITWGAFKSLCHQHMMVLFQGRITEWLQASLGWAAGSTLPSVRCGLEGALLSALADARRLPLHALLAGCPLRSDGSPTGTAVNALLHCQGSPVERAEEAKHLVCQGYKTLKIKVQMISVLLCCIIKDSCS